METCSICGGTGHGDLLPSGGGISGDEPFQMLCVECGGTGQVTPMDDLVESEQRAEALTENPYSDYYGQNPLHLHNPRG